VINQAMDNYGNVAHLCPLEPYFSQWSYIRLKQIHSRLRKLLLILLASVFSVIYCFATSSAVNEILINEVELNPAGSDISAEKVELYNPSSSVIDLSGWTVSSTAGTAAAIVIKGRTTIPPNGYLIVGIDSQWLDNTEETVELWDGSGNLIDSVGLFSDVKNDAATWQ
jgi:hypothetical protein